MVTKGFTLIETLVTAVIIGIVAAIAAPNLIGLMNATRVKQGIAQVEGAIKEAQRQAIRESKSCTVNIDNPSTGYNYVRGASCISSERKLPTNAKIATNDTAIIFSSKGIPDNGTDSIFVVHMPNGTNEQRCLVVAPGLGIMRTGEYDGDPTGTLDAINCVALP